MNEKASDAFQSIDFGEFPRILSVGFGAADELLLVLEPGNLLRCNRKTYENEWVQVGLKTNLRLSDGSNFDPEAPTSYYILDGHIVVANDFLLHGIIIFPGGKRTLNIRREGYHADITQYPLALFRRNGVPHLIYSTAWNRVDILNLATLQNLTAAKSLIDSGAEARHNQLVEQYPGHNVHIWPSNIDYFYGRIIMSPDEQRFLSRGWVWGSSDHFYIFEVEDFIANPLINGLSLFGGSHDNRGVCWMDNDRVALLYNPRQEGDTDALDEATQIHIHRIDQTTGAPEEIVRLEDTSNIESGLDYHPGTDRFVTYSRNQRGISAYNRQGKLQFRHPDRQIDAVSMDRTEFASIGGTTLHIYRLAADNRTQSEDGASAT